MALCGQGTCASRWREHTCQGLGCQSCSCLKLWFVGGLGCSTEQGALQAGTGEKGGQAAPTPASGLVVSRSGKDAETHVREVTVRRL